MVTRIVSITDLKANLASFVARLDTEGAPLYVTQHGKPKAVLMKYDEYEALMEKVEDLEDIVAMNEAMSTPEEESITLDEYERRRASS